MHVPTVEEDLHLVRPDQPMTILTVVDLPIRPDGRAFHIPEKADEILYSSKTSIISVTSLRSSNRKTTM
jgi:hypothetical protein